MTPRHAIGIGLRFPYDCVPTQDSPVGYDPGDWARKAALAVLADLCDRRDVKSELDKVDADVRREIVDTLGAIIREAHATFG